MQQDESYEEETIEEMLIDLAWDWCEGSILIITD